MDNLTIAHHRSGDDSTVEITVSGRLAIDTVADLLAVLREQMPTAARIRLNLSDVSEVDLSGIQLVCSACRDATLAQRRFDFAGSHSAAVKRAIIDVGLQRYSTCKHNADMPCIWHQGAD